MHASILARSAAPLRRLSLIPLGRSLNLMRPAQAASISYASALYRSAHIDPAARSNPSVNGIPGLPRPNVSIRQAKSPEEIQEAIDIRRRIFVDEVQVSNYTQDCPIDKGAFHVISQITEQRLDPATGESTPVTTTIGAVRGFENPEGEGVQLGRLVVDTTYRGLGLGRKLMIECERVAAELYPQHKLIVIDAVLDKIEFYGHLGYVRDPVKGYLTKEGHPLLRMTKLNDGKLSRGV
ncbi:hypothetical protein IWQ60_012395 [Tieghemiomyces parasiticus]|uniref:N-acetyltransferase domain-containing protein n=1 Tax=Tieghemiomyces parasiticus TaxID=78921 RepID=A0A9W7ZLS9_9FUNG|nr:hypothetical protein IWQ60_012395 [Tieghemiomyces parasiticus]